MNRDELWNEYQRRMGLHTEAGIAEATALKAYHDAIEATNAAWVHAQKAYEQWQQAARQS